jgi:hypothetical protein
MRNDTTRLRASFCSAILFFLLLLPVRAQMVEGIDIPGFEKTFGLDFGKKGGTLAALLVESSIPGNVLWPGDKARLLVQLQNNTNRAVDVGGRLDVIAYGTKGRPGDIWVPVMSKIGDAGYVPLSVRIEPNGFRDIELAPEIPERFGAYGIVADLGEYGRTFLTSCVRTFASNTERLQFPSFCLDDISNRVLSRLGVQAIRHGVEYKPTTDPDFQSWYQEEAKKLRAYQEANIAVLIKIGAPAPNREYEPLGMPRPWLDDINTMMDTKSDYAWLPSYDEDFKKLVYRIACEFGWPKGPVNAFALWNEPWDGISISGWGADIPRYREIYTKLAEGVEAARRDAGVDMLVGGCSSTANALDKLFGDGKDTFLDRFDFCSIHYQGMDSYATIKKWVNRKSPRGRVRVWDTESWVANTDDRVAAVVATNRSTGYDRAMGIYAGNICHVHDHAGRTEGGGRKRVEVTHTWSVAASIGAVQHFVGERPFRELLFKNGLPWIMVFDGQKDATGKFDPDDGTLVVVGDIGEEFGANKLLFRTARGLAEIEHKANLKKELASLPPDAKPSAKDSLASLLRRNEVLGGAFLRLGDGGGCFRSYDFYGNAVESRNGKIVIPLDHRVFFLRTDGSQGSFAALLDRVRKSRIEGFEPLATVAHDLIRPVSEKPDLRLTLTNILNRPVTGTCRVRLGKLLLDRPDRKLSFKPHETREVRFRVKGGKASPDNTYPFTLVFDTGADGRAVHEEDLHVNRISKKSIRVDGDLEDWKDALPQTIRSSGSSGPSLTEAAWYPFKTFDKSLKQGFANGYLAYDGDFFYFSAKVADDTPDPGMVRFETRDADAFFYPDTVYRRDNGATFSVRWRGKVRPKVSEQYTFSTLSDDGTRLWIDGRLLIDNWTFHGPTEDFGTVPLTAGRFHDIRMEMFQGGGGALVRLCWESRSQVKQVIPKSCLFQPENGKLPARGNGLSAEYYNGMEFNSLRASRVDSTIDFTWNEGDLPDRAFADSPLQILIWPQGVRRYSYRMNPELPSGNFPDHDNVQIAFNVLPADEKEMLPCPPGTMPGYTNYQCTDYEYALNPVAERYGGGVEIWRMKVPGSPHKHFYPRQDASSFDGPVKSGKLAVRRDGNTRIVEAALPWAEIPDVRKCLDQGKPIKFSFRVNDNAGSGCMELARDRSVSKINNSFRVDWTEHWANEVEFGWEK